MTMTQLSPRTDLDLRRRGTALREEMLAVALDPSDPRLRLVAVGRHAIDEQVERIESMARASVTRMQTGWRLPGPCPETVRPVRLSVMVPEQAVARCPLLACPGTGVRVAPVAMDLTLVDDHVAMIAGPVTRRHEPTLYASTNHELLLPLRELRDDLLEVSEPAEDAADVPTSRQLEVARSLARGDKDVTTARRLGTSVRTVEREVSAILALVGAGNRREATMILNGAAR